MKLSLKALVLPSLLTTCALAQGVNIGDPAPGTSIPTGQNFTVRVDRPDTITGSTEVAVVIALQSCSSGSCLNPADLLGSILYNGPYNPQFEGPPSLPPHQNFSVQVPASFPTGTAQLAVVHVTLIGAGPEPLLQIVNETITVV